MDFSSPLPIALAITTFVPNAMPMKKFKINPMIGLFAPTAATGRAYLTLPDYYNSSFLLNLLLEKAYDYAIIFIKTIMFILFLFI